MVNQLRHNVRLVSGFIAVVLRLIAVAAAGQVDENRSARAKQRVTNDAGIFIGSGAAQPVNEHHGIAGAGQVVPAHGATGLLRVKLFISTPFMMRCVFIQLSHQECYVHLLKLEACFRKARPAAQRESSLARLTPPGKRSAGGYVCGLLRGTR